MLIFWRVERRVNGIMVADGVGRILIADRCF